MAIYRGPGGPGDATTDATSQATVATTKAAEASASAVAAASSASTASDQGTLATTKASEASSSASAASSSASTATTQATNSATSATNSANSAAASLSSQEDAETAQGLAETAQVAAETAQTNAETAETNAGTSASNASSSASAASTSASNAATSETNAAASFDSFDDRYLGAKASGPALDNDGNALLTGALYWNTTVDSLYVWSGSAWNAAAFTAEGSVVSFNTRTGVITLSSGDVTDALGFTPSTVSDLTSLSDVTITTASNGQVLKYNGSAWVNSTDTDTYPGSSWYSTTNNSGNWDTAYGWGNHASSGYLTSFTETNDLTAAVTWANIPDANVPASAVTQHQASLSVTESQISDLGTYVPTSAIGSTVQAYDATIVVDADIGSTVQGYDVDTAKTDVAQTFTTPQRGTSTTDNDLSFDLSVTNNFTCTPSGTGTLTFTNHTAGQSGYVLLINTGGYAISAAATTKVTPTFLATVSTAGTYLVAYYDDGTNAYCTTSGVMA